MISVDRLIVLEYLKKKLNKHFITRVNIIDYCKKQGMKRDDWDMISNEEMISWIKIADAKEVSAVYIVEKTK
jgi:hypothetical protein